MTATLEAVVERMEREADSAALAAARVEFEAATGPFAPGEPWYEERIAAFFDFALGSYDGGRLARAFAARADVPDAERALALALARAERSTFRVERRDGAIVCESLFGARYRVADEGTGARLRDQDRFDGRLVAIDGRILVAPGTVFHPAEAHEAIDRLLDEVATRGAPRVSLPDALLRMRMRFDRFTSMHARHVYRYEAIERMEILAASWHRPTP